MIIPKWPLRRYRRIYQRSVLTIFGGLFLIDAFFILWNRGPTVRVRVEDGSGGSSGSGTTEKDKPSVFIVSVHRNNEQILHVAWVDAIVALVDHLGRDNVYVSAVESGSQDHTKDELIRLRTMLETRGVDHAIDLGSTAWEQLEELNTWPYPNSPPEARRGWIWHAAENHFALRRIPYLARVRNQAMAPLHELAAQGRRFDRILWINDVVFDTSDVLTLLSTRGGKYAAACAVDFMVYPLYYDTFALRDERGEKAVSLYWPWFRSKEARADVMASRPVRVRSCWNGMVVFNTAPFYSSSNGSSGDGDDESSLSPPLRFRGIDDSLAELHLEGSECCLIHADNPQSDARDADDGGLWLNPNVRVGYTMRAYKDVRGGVFPGVGAAVASMWVNRWQRLHSYVQYTLETQTVLNRLQRWRAETPPGNPPRNEPGAMCLINEMQIMWRNGWKHI